MWVLSRAIQGDLMPETQQGSGGKLRMRGGLGGRRFASPEELGNAATVTLSEASTHHGFASWGGRGSSPLKWRSGTETLDSQSHLRNMWRSGTEMSDSQGHSRIAGPAFTPSRPSSASSTFGSPKKRYFSVEAMEAAASDSQRHIQLSATEALALREASTAAAREAVQSRHVAESERKKREELETRLRELVGPSETISSCVGAAADDSRGDSNSKENGELIRMRRRIHDLEVALQQQGQGDMKIRVAELHRELLEAQSTMVSLRGSLAYAEQALAVERLARDVAERGRHDDALRTSEIIDDLQRRLQEAVARNAHVHQQWSSVNTRMEDLERYRSGADPYQVLSDALKLSDNVQGLRSSCQKEPPESQSAESDMLQANLESEAKSASIPGSPSASLVPKLLTMSDSENTAVSPPLPVLQADFAPSVAPQAPAAPVSASPPLPGHPLQSVGVDTMGRDRGGEVPVPPLPSAPPVPVPPLSSAPLVSQLPSAAAMPPAPQLPSSAAAPSIPQLPSSAASPPVVHGIMMPTSSSPAIPTATSVPSAPSPPPLPGPVAPLPPAPPPLPSSVVGHSPSSPQPPAPPLHTASAVMPAPAAPPAPPLPTTHMAPPLAAAAPVAPVAPPLPAAPQPPPTTAEPQAKVGDQVRSRGFGNCVIEKLYDDGSADISVPGSKTMTRVPPEEFEIKTKRSSVFKTKSAAKLSFQDEVLI